MMNEDRRQIAIESHFNRLLQTTQIVVLVPGRIVGVLVPAQTRTGSGHDFGHFRSSEIDNL